MRYIFIIIVTVLMTGCLQSQQTNVALSLQNPAELLREQSDKFEGSLQLESELRTLFDDEIVTAAGHYVYPIAEYTTLRTKVFGQYQTPGNDELTSGYHTGDDIAASDSATAMPIYALTDAKVVRRETVPGYGGVVILEFADGIKTHHALYGYVDLATVTSTAGQTVTAGSLLGYVAENETKHLFFSIYPYTGTELFAENVDQNIDLELWVNPADFLREHEALELAAPAA